MEVKVGKHLLDFQLLANPMYHGLKVRLWCRTVHGFWLDIARYNTVSHASTITVPPNE